MTQEQEQAKNRVAKNEYPLGPLGIIRRNHDMCIISGNYGSRIYKSSIVKRIYKKVKQYLKFKK